MFRLLFPEPPKQPATTDMDDYEEAVLFTFALLESRLDRIEYVLSGGKKQAEEKPKTFPERVQRIERSLQELSKKTTLLNDVQDLSTTIAFYVYGTSLTYRQSQNTLIS